MARSTAAHLTPSVLRWARETAGYTSSQAARAIKVNAWEIELAEDGDFELTMRQAEKLAEFYGRPLVTFYLPDPPVEESQEAQFRRLPGAPAPPWPPELRKLTRRVNDRQAAASELYELLEEVPPWPKIRARLAPGVHRRSPSEFAIVVREAFEIGVDEQLSWTDAQGYEALRNWIDAVEALGVLVMQDGSLDLSELRGFASIESDVPAILINTKDDPRARAFTLMHELAHLLMPSALETWCNDFAGEVLMPAAALRAVVELHADEPAEKWVADAARAFSVTQYAVAVRVARIELLSPERSSALIAFIRSRGSTPREPGGNYYRNKVAWLGPAFVRLVLGAADQQAVTLSSAAGLLEAKVDHFAGLRDVLDSRAELG